MERKIISTLVLMFCIMSIIKMYSGNFDLIGSDIHVIKQDEVKSNRNVINILKIAFPTFYELIKKGGNAADIESAKAITIFAPTEAAFKKFKEFTGEDFYNDIINNPQKLRQMLELLIVPDESLTLESIQKQNIQPFKNHGITLRSHDGDSTPNEVSVIESDIIGTNGVVHAINSFVIP